MTLFDQISNDIIAAMKAKEKERLSALRNIKKIFIEAKTAPGANDTLTDDTALKLLQKLAKQGRDSATLYQANQRGFALAGGSDKSSARKAPQSTPSRTAPTSLRQSSSKWPSSRSIYPKHSHPRR